MSSDRPPLRDVVIYFIPEEAEHWVSLAEGELDHAARCRAEYYVHGVLGTSDGMAIKLERCPDGHLLYMVE